MANEYIDLEDCIEMEEELKPGECNCGNLRQTHQREISGCEYHNHHCDLCHEAGICTEVNCKIGR